MFLLVVHFNMPVLRCETRKTETKIDMTMGLIDANALMNFCNNLRDKTIDANDIARFPTVDAEPVKHGRWVDFTPEEYLCPLMVCSVCETVQAPHAEWQFCPYCGAKMDEGEVDDGKTD
jgi:hypothetical protein